jgi:hypothetical protein
MLKKCFLVSLMLCLSLLGTTRPSSAQELQATSDDPIAQMQRQGWKIVQNGVLQRELRAGQVESFVFGPEGFTWKVQDLRAHLQKLRHEFQAHPTPELQKAITGFRQEIASTQQLIQRARIAEAQGETGIDKTSCSINFAYAATASYGTSVQGTWGNASANFTGTCGFTGQVYATAYSKVTVSGAPTTKTVTDGPRTGANVSASAYASLNGGAVCESTSYASMTSSSLSPSSYTMSASNSVCPGSVTLTTLISGPTYVDATVSCTTSTWTASPSGGTSPYTYQWTWNGTAVGTGSSYSRTTCPGAIYSDTFNTLGLTASDSASHAASASLSVEVEKGNGTGCAPTNGSVPCQ